jgi:hypothetical protein
MAHEEKLIEYLTKEIETQTKNLMAFRERINFAVFVGPFVLLGAALYGKSIVPHINWGSWSTAAWIGLGLSFLLAILSYLTMGIACSLIERHMWDQCNIWRRLIADISKGRSDGLTFADLEFKEYLLRGYLWVYITMVIAFGSAIAFIAILREHAI